ncbi:50S ribosomal protein L23P [archaeon GW2011_AR15]|nr:50S ribosomal protein L23P [archaeon GW2011_AR15]MBS3103864.1 50S ribosomal protein L23 [Candidatus Woesearchaeota archaeon]
MIIKYPLATEKTIRLMESDNSLIFIVERSATKKQVKEAVESLYKVKVARVNTTIDPKGRKKAYVKLSDETPAIDLATQLGIM